MSEEEVIELEVSDHRFILALILLFATIAAAFLQVKDVYFGVLGTMASSAVTFYFAAKHQKDE